MQLSSEQEMLDYGQQLAKTLKAPVTLELIGDVGAGKTTLVRGIAQGLNVAEPVTSPSFTISRQYATPDGRTLIHYDFYRLSDPGLMAEDLAESISSPTAITIIEWADSVADVLPKNHRQFTITINDDGSRTITEASPQAAAEPVKESNQ